MLTEQVQVIVPSTIDTNNTASAELVADMTRQALTELATVAGGATSYDGIGAYVADDGQLVTEAVKIVYAMTTPGNLPALTEAAHDVARIIKTTMRQEAVSVVINGAMSFI